MTDMNKEDCKIKAWCDAQLDMILNLRRREWTREMNEIVDRFNNFIFSMPRKIKVSKEKEEYFNFTERFEAAINKIIRGADDVRIAERYELDLETLRDERRRFRRSTPGLYDYIVKGKIFSYKEELAILDVLATIPNNLCCLCRKCTLERLPFLAYHVAQRKRVTKSFPIEWNRQQKAGKEWQTNFEIEYEYELSNSFPKNCTKDRIRNCQDWEVARYL